MADARFVSPESRGRWTRNLLIACAVLAAAAIAAGFSELDLLARAEGGDVTDAEVEANDLRQGVIGVLGVALYVATPVAFLLWFHRVHANLPALGVRTLDYSSAWTFWGFVVPILSFIRPMYVMREVWHGSDPQSLMRDRERDSAVIHSGGTPALVVWWWVFFTLSGAFAGVGYIAFVPDPNLDVLRTVGVVDLLSDVCDLGSAGLAVRIVERITSWQRARATLVAS